MYINNTLYGTGSMAKDSARGYMSDLNREAAGRKPQEIVTRRPKDIREVAGLAGGVAGIKVVGMGAPETTPTPIGSAKGLEHLGGEEA